MVPPARPGRLHRVEGGPQRHSVLGANGYYRVQEVTLHAGAGQGPIPGTSKKQEAGEGC